MDIDSSLFDRNLHQKDFVHAANDICSGRWSLCIADWFQTTLILLELFISLQIKCLR